MKQFIAAWSVLAFVLQTTLAFADTRYIETDQVVIGKKTSVNPALTFRGLPNGIRVNSSTGLIEYTNDNTNFLQVGSGGGGGVGTELLPNGDFELGGVTSGWTATGLTAANVTDATRLTAPFVIDKKFSANLTATAVGQTFKSAAFPVLGLSGGSCAASLRYLYTGNAGDWVLTVSNGTSTIASLPLAASTSGNAPQTTVFSCGTTPTSTLQFILTSAVASPGALNFDNAHLGAVQLYQGLVNGQPTVVKQFTASGTYTPSAGVTQIEVYMVGGGGGGGASGTSAGGTAGAGGPTTFGTLLTAGGGGAGAINGAGAVGGQAVTVNAPAIAVLAMQGNGGGSVTSPGTGISGAGIGGASLFGGGANSTGGTGNASPIAGPPQANSGSGGSGAQWNGGTGFGGSGGGSGAYIDAIIPIGSIGASYAISIGTGGNGASAGGSGAAGAAGAAGQVIIRETFQTVTQQAFLPAGGGLAAGDTVSGAWAQCPTGTIAADGSAISRAQYPALFAAAGTTFGAGDGSTTFNLPLVTQIGGSTPLVSYGVNQITATTTAPTKGSTVINDVVRAGQASGDHWRIKGEYKQTAAGAVGSGDYLFLMPNGLQFDPSKTSFYTVLNNGPNQWPSNVALGSATLSNNSFQGTGVVIPYDATHFRIGVIYDNTSGNGYDRGIFGAGVLPFNQAVVSFTYDFEAPILSYATSYLKTCVRTTAASAAPILFGGVNATDNASGTTVINTSQTFTASATLSPNIETAFGNTTTAAFTLTLPDATLNKSKKFLIKKTDSSANILTVQAFGAQTIDGITAYKMGTQFDNFTVQSDGANWQVVQNNVSVNATYGLTTAQSVAANAVVKYDTKTNDSHSAFSTTSGLFTCPVNGMYRVSVVISSNAANAAYAKVNGISAGNLGVYNAAGPTSASISVRCLSSQTIGIYFDTSVTATATNATWGFTNQVTFEKTGN